MAITTNAASTQEVLNGPDAANVAAFAVGLSWSVRWSCEFLVQTKPPDHLADVGFPRAVAELKSIAVNQLPDVFRQPLGRRHLCPLQEHWGHRDIPLEGSGNFLAYEIRGTLQATISCGVLCIKPAGADKRQHQIAGLEALVQNVTEVLP